MLFICKTYKLRIDAHNCQTTFWIAQECWRRKKRHYFHKFCVFELILNGVFDSSIEWLWFCFFFLSSLCVHRLYKDFMVYKVTNLISWQLSAEQYSVAIGLCSSALFVYCDTEFEGKFHSKSIPLWINCKLWILVLWNGEKKVED